MKTCLFFLFLAFGLLAEDKKTVTYSLEQKEDLVIIHLSLGFPLLSENDKFGFGSEFREVAKVRAARIVQTVSGTDVSFLCDSLQDSRVQIVLSIIQKRIRKLNIELKKLPAPPPSPIMPARDPSRLFL